MQIMREALVECFNDCDELVREYYASTKAREQVPPIDFDWSHYIAIEHQRRIVLVTARTHHHGQLIGFALYMMVNHPHHKTVPMAICDTLAVRPSHRSMGIGRNLMAHAEDLLRDYNMYCVIHMFRAVYADDVVPLFPRLGFVPFESSYMKVLAH